MIFDIVNNIENLYSIDAIEEEMKVAINYYRSHDGEGFVVNETFELIDKVADCKALFDELEGTLSASWDLMYEQAKIYYEQNGNLDVPKRYFTPEGYSLGLWLLTQRRVYNGTVNGILTQVQIDKLNEIGMRWESKSDVSWEKYYESAKRYYEANGDLQPKALYVDENDIEKRVEPSQIQIGDTLVVRAGEKVAVDGVVVKGTASLNTASLTGESKPQDVDENDIVLSGSIVLEGLLEIKVTEKYENSIKAFR